MPAIKGVKRLPSGGIMYRGERFPGFNKPKAAPAGDIHKKRVLAKKGNKVKVVPFGHRGYQDYTQHGSKKRRANYLKRSAGIRDKNGNLTKNDVFSANRWSRTHLWPSRD
jgi:hypothetical protein